MNEGNWLLMSWSTINEGDLCMAVSWDATLARHGGGAVCVYVRVTPIPFN